MLKYCEALEEMAAPALFGISFSQGEGRNRIEEDSS